MRYSLPRTCIAAGVLLATTVQALNRLMLKCIRSAQTVWRSLSARWPLSIPSMACCSTPSLTGLEPGVYGFHVHQNASCEPAENDSGEMTAALSAGGHYDPDETGTHRGLTVKATWATYRC